MPMHAILDALSRLQQRHALALFLLFGAALFAVEHLRRPPPLVLPSEGLRSDEVPTWMEEEVLYREARARGLDDGDLIVRRRLVQKMRQLLETSVEVAPPDDATLRAWMEAHPGRYGGIERLSFDHLFLSRARHGDRVLAEAVSLATRLAAEPDLEWTALADPHPAGTGRTEIPGRALEGLFGSALAEALAALPIGAWQPPRLSPQGAHLFRIRSRELRQPDGEAVRERAHRDWLLAQRSEGTEAAIRSLLRGHAVVPP